MISLIITLAVLGLIYWICATLGVPQPFLKIILVVLVVVALITVLNAFGYSTGVHTLR